MHDAPVTSPRTFPADYFAAREQFRDGVEALGWTWASMAIDARGPRGEELTIDAARHVPPGCRSVLVISSGLHGVEGFLGSAVQAALLDEWRMAGPPRDVGILLLHALNPYGFAWHRRVNEENVDLNRNFLLPGDPFRGATEGYARLEGRINPPRPPSRWGPARLITLAMVARYGLQTMLQAVVTGQYDYPRGVFYGGAGPSRTQQILAENLAGWLAGAERVLHLDIHTGLGRWGNYRLLADAPLDPGRVERLLPHFGPGRMADLAASSDAYVPRGSIGLWWAAQPGTEQYQYFCAEFGTYGAITVFAGLRAENQATHWCRPDDPAVARTRQRLLELFCPRSAGWRRRSLEQGVDLIHRGIAALRSGGTP
jgi:hypothetical protein